MYNTLFCLAMATSVFSSPFKAKRSQFDCNVAYTGCLSSPYVEENLCPNIRDQCQSCWQAEQSCRVNADYEQGIACTIAAERCFHSQNVQTVLGAYGCDAAYSTCSNAPNPDMALCSSQLSACKSCETQENQCRTAAGANQAFCSSQSASCFEGAITVKSA